jgi:hypothetical protein
MAARTDAPGWQDRLRAERRRRDCQEALDNILDAAAELEAAAEGNTGRADLAEQLADLAALLHEAVAQLETGAGL